jgi:hypothetical protein
MKRYKWMYFLTLAVGLALALYLLIVPVGSTGGESFEEVEEVLPGYDIHAEAREPIVIVYPYYNVPLSHEIQEDLRCACDATGVDMVLALAVIQRETDFRNVVGDSGDSFGYMQVQPKWHKERMERLGVTDLMEPLSNFRVGCDYLAKLLERYSLEDALTVYNSGSTGESEYAFSVIQNMEGITVE